MTPTPRKRYSLTTSPFRAIRSTSIKKIGIWVSLLGAGMVTSCVTVDRLLSNTEHATPSQAHESCINTGSNPETGDSCLICHHDHKKNHHPVDFTPPHIDLINIDENKFPLFGGKIQCFTCHTADGEYIKGNDKLLRGGPYNDNRTLCFKCHYQDKYSQINVHLMHEEGGGLRTIEGKLVCTFCHPQNINNLYSTETVEFKADISFLCLRCHPEMSAPHIKGHFSIVPTEKTKNKIRAFEDTHNVILPLVPRGKMTCATCHNPHQKGVLIDERAMAGADSEYLLRIEKNLLCYGCHL